MTRCKANVLINNSGQPLLSDFGLAVIVEDLTQMPISSALEGSGNPRWMAPELFLGQEIVSKASDVWSLGMFYLEVSDIHMYIWCYVVNASTTVVDYNSGRAISRLEDLPASHPGNPSVQEARTSNQHKRRKQGTDG